MLFPSTRVALRCLKFLTTQSKPGFSSTFQSIPDRGNDVRLMDLVLEKSAASTTNAESRVTMISAVLFPKRTKPLAAKFWQHSGDGISSRRADFFHKAFTEGHLVPRQRDKPSPASTKPTSKGPRRYQKGGAD